MTLCTHERECLFGEIDGDSKMRLNAFGEIVQEEWEQTGIVRANVELDAFVVMPNHVHGILVIVGGKDDPEGLCKGDPPGRPYMELGRPYMETGRPYVDPTGPVAGSLGAIMGQFKAVVSRRINVLRGTPGWTVWHRNYFERIVSDRAPAEQRPALH